MASGRVRLGAGALGVLALVSSAALAGCSSASAPSGLSPPQLLNAGIAASGKGNSDQARADYKAVIQRDPSNRYGLNKIAWYDLGVLDQKQGNTQAARSEYEQALQIDPKYLNALYNLAVLETSVNAQAAISLYRQVLAQTPNDPNAQWNLGLLLYRNGQVAEARTLMNSAIKVAPSLATKLPPGVTLTP